MTILQKNSRDRNGKYVKNNAYPSLKAHMGQPSVKPLLIDRLKKKPPCMARLWTIILPLEPTYLKMTRNVGICYHLQLCQSHFKKKFYVIVFLHFCNHI